MLQTSLIYLNKLNGDFVLTEMIVSKVSSSCGLLLRRLSISFNQERECVSGCWYISGIDVFWNNLLSWYFIDSNLLTPSSIESMTSLLCIDTLYTIYGKGNTKTPRINVQSTSKIQSNITLKM